MIPNKTVNILADIFVTDAAHQLFLLKRSLHRIPILNHNLLHYVDIIVHYATKKTSVSVYFTYSSDSKIMRNAEYMPLYK